jgi:hypothetical protein
MSRCCEDDEHVIGYNGDDEKAGARYEMVGLRGVSLDALMSADSRF